MMPAFPPADRARAYRIERKLKAEEIEIDDLPDSDRTFIADYRQRTAQRTQATERITHTEERSLDHASGDAGALEAMGAAQLAREEGRRLDTIVNRGFGALNDSISAHKDACTIYKGMVHDLLERSKEQDAAVVSMLVAMRDHFIARAEAEAALIAHQAQNVPQGEIGEMIEMMRAAKEMGLVDMLKKRKGQGKGKSKATDRKPGKPPIAPADPKSPTGGL